MGPFCVRLSTGPRDIGSIEGRVVAYSTESPLKSAIVRLRRIPAAGGQTKAEFVQQTNEERHFFFAGIAAGEWELSAEKRGFVPAKYGMRKRDPKGSPISLKK